MQVEPVEVGGNRAMRSFEETQNDPFQTPMVFLRIGWMEWYQGLARNDEIRGGGEFVEQHGYGHEIFNFQPFKGHVFGYVQPSGGGHNQPGSKGIRIERLGATNNHNSVSGVLAVWVATAPHGGCFVVGWYANATIHRHWQESPAGANRRHPEAEDEFGFCVTADENDSVLLPTDERGLEIPRGSGGIGQSIIWYADDPNVHVPIRRDVLRLVATRSLPKLSDARIGDSSRQPDPLRRQRVEQCAVETITEYFMRIGYTVDSVEADNLGWDLEAVRGDIKLRLEVKGLSGSEVCVDVTPGEYAKMQEYRDSYRLCIVTDALTKPKRSVFAFSNDLQRWTDQDAQALEIEEIVAARCRVAPR
jgi:Protein NO VEIN, C-terminal